MKKIEVVAAIIKEGERIFATQRGYGEHKGYWEFPGGKIEPGETRHQALKREIKEELGIDITINKLVSTIEYQYSTFHLTMHCYLCTCDTQSIELHEHLSAKWITQNELNTLNWLPADLQLLPALHAILTQTNDNETTSSLT